MPRMGVTYNVLPFTTDCNGKKDYDHSIGTFKIEEHAIECAKEYRYPYWWRKSVGVTVQKSTREEVFCIEEAPKEEKPE